MEGNILIFSELITRAIRELLEAKHLYQSVSLPAMPFPKTKITPDDVAQFRNATQIHGTWRPSNPAIYVGPDQNSGSGLVFEIPHATMYCITCDRRQPFNPDVVTQPSAGSLFYMERRNASGAIQVFAISYVCQGCKGVPEVVLIRREGLRLTLCGRAPIEFVEVPKAIPKSVTHYYSGAIVAHQSGQTLSGLFMLRTCVEQWVASRNPGQKRADDALKLYLDSLPVDFKNRFPSLSAIYTDISIALHAANADASLFEKSCGEIVEHFEALKLFRIG